MKLYRLHSSLRINKPLEELFPFFADAYNLQELTPPWLKFSVLTPRPIPMKVGQTIDYQLRIRGVPIRWTSEITVWEPPHRFVDEQRRGPYRAWIHEHRFTPDGDATIVEDDVRYSAPGGAWVNKLLVERDVKKIFGFRADSMREIFETKAAATDFIRIAA